MTDAERQLSEQSPHLRRAAEAAYDTYWLTLLNGMSSAYAPWHGLPPEAHLAWCAVVEAVLDLQAHGQI